MKRNSMFDVFISYRRDGGSALAQLVREHLTRRGYRVFMDVRDLRAGEFDQALVDTIAGATDVVVLVTPHCFERSVNDTDWFRKEIETALGAKCNVVPLRTDDAVLPDPDQLPPSIARLSKHQCVTFNSEFCDAGMDRLSKMLKSRPRLSSRLSRPIAVAGVLLLVVAGVLLGVGLIPREDPLVLHWYGQGQRERDGRWEDFPLRDNMTMYSGDQFRLSFIPTDDCYVYVIGIDARGEKMLLFPNSAIEQDHFCRANQEYEIPDGDNLFTLDQNTGRERIYLLASRTPLDSLEMILDTYESIGHEEVAQTLDETADLIMDRQRGVEVQPDRRVTVTTNAQGAKVKQEMNFVAGKAAAVHVLDFVHQAALTGQAASNQ
jgi:hypothetical protein